MTKELFETLKKTVDGFSKILGNQTEIALHDLEKREMVYIVNGHITGRDVGYQLDSSVYDSLLNLADENGLIIGYSTQSLLGTKLRSSHISYNDRDGKPAALICINQDVTKLNELRDFVDSLLATPSADSADGRGIDENYIQNVTKNVILDTIGKTKPSGLSIKEAKMQILAQLESKGVFSVKDSVPIVCKALSISQATLYNYLRELRT